MSALVGKPEDRFSDDAAHFVGFSICHAILFSSLITQYQNVKERLVFNFHKGLCWNKWESKCLKKVILLYIFPFHVGK